jgi:hypothetical protein
LPQSENPFRLPGVYPGQPNVLPLCKMIAANASTREEKRLRACACERMRREVFVVDARAWPGGRALRESFRFDPRDSVVDECLLTLMSRRKSRDSIKAGLDVVTASLSAVCDTRGIQLQIPAD